MPGRAEFAYLLRVTTPGQFRAMPAQVTPMYVPGVHASSAALSLDVPSSQEPAMIAAVIRTALWMGVVDALAGAALLGFLYTPEANVLMLGVSTLLVVVAGVLLLLSSTSASHGLVHGVAPWSSVGAAARHLPLVLRGPDRARRAVRRRGLVRDVVDVARRRGRRGGDRRRRRHAHRLGAHRRALDRRARPVGPGAGLVRDRPGVDCRL